MSISRTFRTAQVPGSKTPNFRRKKEFLHTRYFSAFQTKNPRVRAWRVLCVHDTLLVPVTDNKHASTTRLLFPEDQNLIILRADFTIARSPTYSYLPSNTQHATLKIALRLKRQHQNRVKIKEAYIRHLLILQHDLDRRRSDRATAVCTDYYLLLPLLCPAQMYVAAKHIPS